MSILEKIKLLPLVELWAAEKLPKNNKKAAVATMMSLSLRIFTDYKAQIFRRNINYSTELYHFEDLRNLASCKVIQRHRFGSRQEFFGAFDSDGLA